MRINPRHALTLTLVLAIGLVSCAAPTATGKTSMAIAQVNALFDEFWEGELRENRNAIR